MTSIRRGATGVGADLRESVMGFILGDAEFEMLRAMAAGAGQQTAEVWVRGSGGRWRVRSWRLWLGGSCCGGRGHNSGKQGERRRCLSGSHPGCTGRRQVELGDGAGLIRELKAVASARLLVSLVRSNCKTKQNKNQFCTQAGTRNA